MTDREATAWIRSWGERWKQETGAGWAVTDGSRVLGRVGLKRIDLDEALGEVAYWVLADARGQRAGTRALCAMSDWAFASGFHRLELVHAVENHALVSRRPGCRVSPGGNKAPRRAARRRLARHAPSRRLSDDQKASPHSALTRLGPPVSTAASSPFSFPVPPWSDGRRCSGKLPGESGATDMPPSPPTARPSALTGMSMPGRTPSVRGERPGSGYPSLAALMLR